MERLNREIEALGIYLKRSAWILTALIALVAVGLVWAVRERQQEIEGEAQHRNIAELAVATELAATTLESATRFHAVFDDTTALRRARREDSVLAATFDSLKAQTRGDDSATMSVRVVDSTLRIWRERFVVPVITARTAPQLQDPRPEVLLEVRLFEPVREYLNALVREETARYFRHVQRRLVLQRYFAVAATVAIVAMLAVLVHMRRRLRRQLSAANHAMDVIVSQTNEVRAQRDALTTQAAELIDQRQRLEDQAIELEETVEQLRTSEREQYLLTENTQRLNRRLEEAQEVARLGYWEVDATHGTVFWSDEMYRLIGLVPTAGVPPTEYFLSRVHPEDRSHMEEIAAKAVSEARPFSIDYRLLGADNTYRTMHAVGRTLQDGAEKRKLVGTVQDVTERTGLENQLRQSQKIEAVGRLAGGIAHDFNNMLTVVMSCAQMLRESVPNVPEVTELIDEILGSGERAASLTRQLLNFSRGRLVQPVTVDVNTVLRHIEPMLARLVGEDVRIVVDVPEQPLFVVADPHQLDQVMMNLVVNARDAMPRGGQITISAEHCKVVSDAAEILVPFARVTVRDTGVGMDAATAAHIFEPFFTTKAEGQGTGLGLSTAFGIVQQAGGQLTVESVANAGTTFQILLPLQAEAEAAIAEPTLDEVGRRVVGARVLLVEDDEVVRRSTTRLLERMDYSVVEASHGGAALEAIAAGRVDVVLSDTVMPFVSGPQLARQLAKDRPELPVVLMSGYTADAVARHGPVPDFITLLEKPFSPTQLEEALQYALQQALRRARATS